MSLRISKNLILSGIKPFTPNVEPISISDVNCVLKYVPLPKVIKLALLLSGFM